MIDKLKNKICFCYAGDEKNGNFDHTVINDDLEVAYEKLKGILIKVREVVLD